MSRAELEEEYGTVIQSYKRFLTMGQGDNVTATMDFEDDETNLESGIMK